MSTLLEKAYKVPIRKRKAEITAEHKELVYGWARGVVTTKQAWSALGLTNAASFYVWAATTLRNMIVNGDLTVVPEA